MIKYIALVLLLLIAIAISPTLIENRGYVLISMGNWVVETSILAIIIMFFILSFFILIATKLFKGSLKFSIGTWNKIAFASKRRGERDYKKGIAAYLLGNYQQAEHLLAKSAEPAQQQATAYLVAAKAAEQQQLSANASHYIQLLEHHNESIKNTGIESVLVNLDILMSQQEIAKARALLDQYHTHIGNDNRMLAIEIRLSLLENRFDNAISYITKAKKQKDIAINQLQHWQQQAFYGKFKQIITEQSNQALHNYWNELSRKDKQTDIIILMYCRVLAEHQVTEPLDKLLVPIIKKGSNTALIEQIKTLPLHKPEMLIAAAQHHLQKEQHNSFWLSCLGHFAVAAKDWALAERAFKTMMSHHQGEMTTADVKALAKALAGQEKYQQSAELLLSK